jgi:hypothetical protein
MDNAEAPGELMNGAGNTVPYLLKGVGFEVLYMRIGGLSALSGC